MVYALGVIPGSESGLKNICLIIFAGPAIVSPGNFKSEKNEFLTRSDFVKLKAL
jgi:hypothetical protein